MKVLKACIVGSGPAGFYTAKKMLKEFVNVKVDMYEKLPVPFGLVRYGVAPDHIKVKNVENTFRKTALDQRFTFYGNVSVGSNLCSPDSNKNTAAIDELKKFYNVIVFCIGATGSKKLDIPGENLKNVYTSHKFVNWYNGLPDVPIIENDLLKNNYDSINSIKNVSIFGQGNVALDCARMLVAPSKRLRSTDITTCSLNVLEQLNLTKINIIGRRSPFQAKFSVGEMREFLKLNADNVYINPTDLSSYHKHDKLGRRTERLTRLLRDYASRNNLKTRCRNKADVELRFFQRPVEILPCDNNRDKIGFVKLERMVLNVEDQIDGTGKYEILPCDLLISSIGYKVESMAGLPEISNSNFIPNENSRITFCQKSEGPEDCGKGLYACGWFRRGPSGVILTNIEEANITVKCILEDIKNGTIDLSLTDGLENDGCVLNQIKGIDSRTVVMWHDFLKIDEYEIQQGKKEGKIREKITDINKMLEVAKTTVHDQF